MHKEVWKQSVKAIPTNDNAEDSKIDMIWRAIDVNENPEVLISICTAPIKPIRSQPRLIELNHNNIFPTFFGSSKI